METVQAIAIDEDTIYVECKADKWKKCGNGFGYHLHGNSSKTYEDREESRSSHCKIPYNNILVNSNTYRGTLKKRIKTGKRKGTYIFKK